MSIVKNTPADSMLYVETALLAPDRALRVARTTASSGMEPAIGCFVQFLYSINKSQVVKLALKPS